MVRLVSDGKYWAVRKGLLWHKFLDLKQPKYWWSTNQKYINDCWTEDKGTAYMWFQRVKGGIKRDEEYI